MNSKPESEASYSEYSEEIIFIGTNAPTPKEMKMIKKLRNQEKKCKSRVSHIYLIYP